MRRIQLTWVILALFLAANLQAQPRGKGNRGEGKGIILGKIVDAATKTPLDYSTIIVYSAKDSAQITGATANEKGLFQIPIGFGEYYIIIDFISYGSITINDVIINKNNKKRDLGTVQLSPAAEQIGELEIRAEKSNMQIMLDKKVFNVGQDLANQGGSAEDILDNVPSVAVDIDGNVTLRGNQNVRILINGKPSGLVGIGNTDGLKQIPSNLIDKIEVITNPSARYEAEGTVGILNIILKKDKRKGLNGSFNFTAGYNGIFVETLENSDKIPISLGTAINLNYRRKNFNFFVNLGVNKRTSPGIGTLHQELYREDTTAVLESKRQFTRDGLGLNFRFGSDYYFTEKDILTASFLYRPSSDNNYSEIAYDDSYRVGNIIQPLGISLRSDSEKETEANYQGALTYRKSFKEKGRKFSADFRFQDNGETEQSVIDEFFDLDTRPSISSQPILTQNSINDERETSYQFQTDYVHPFKKNGKFELGYRGSLRSVNNAFEVTEDSDGSGNFVVLESVSDNFIYNENIQAAYTSIGDKIGKFSYQVGLRYEYAYITTESVKLDSVNARTYASPFFPSVFLSYDLPRKNSVQLSYSRRVRRPRFRELNPFFSFTDNRNRYGGNPNLNPEFTHAVELSHIKYFEKGTITSSAYYRITDQTVQRLRRVEIVGMDTLTIMQPLNLDKSYAYGLELTFNADPLKWLRLNGSFNFYRSIIPETASPFDPTYILSNDAYNWQSNLTARFSFDKNTNLQVKFNYRAPRVSLQGESKAIYYLDLGFSKEIFNNKGTLTISANDIFNTRRYRYQTSIEDQLLSDGMFQRRSGSIRVSLNYRLNQKKRRGGGRRPGGNRGGGGEF